MHLVIPANTIAALVPKPRVNLTRFHGVFAPDSRYRAFMPPGARDARRTRPRRQGPRCQWPGAGEADRADRARAARAARAAQRDRLGTAPATRLRHRHRTLCELRRDASDHRLYGRSCRDRDGPRAPAAHESLGKRRGLSASAAPSRSTAHLASRLKSPPRHRRAPEGHEGAQRRPRPEPVLGFQPLSEARRRSGRFA